MKTDIVNVSGKFAIRRRRLFHRPEFFPRDHTKYTLVSAREVLEECLFNTREEAEAAFVKVKKIRNISPKESP